MEKVYLVNYRFLGLAKEILFTLKRYPVITSTIDILHNVPPLVLKKDPIKKIQEKNNVLHNDKVDFSISYTTTKIFSIYLFTEL